MFIDFIGNFTKWLTRRKIKTEKTTWKNHRVSVSDMNVSLLFLGQCPSKTTVTDYDKSTSL